MNNFNFDIPNQVRDIAEKTVDQARKAFESFVGAVQQATAQSEAAAGALTANAREVNFKALSFAEANMKAAFDHAEKLLHAKDPSEILSIQSDYLKRQFATIQEQASVLGESVKKAVTSPPDTK